jgi:hypothetical protein
MNVLPLTNASAESCFEVDIPLHAYTDSATHVAQMVSALLESIAEVDDDVSHSDILQALAITTAIRAGMADAAAQHGADLPLRLLDVQVSSAEPRAQYAA